MVDDTLMTEANWLVSHCRWQQRIPSVGSARGGGPLLAEALHGKALPMSAFHPKRPLECRSQVQRMVGRYTCTTFVGASPPKVSPPPGRKIRPSTTALPFSP